MFRFGGYRRIFKIAPFRLFWFGFTFSELGDAMTRVALTWYVYEATHSAIALGWLMFAYTGPVIVGGLVAGSLLDRFDKRTVMMVDNLVRGVAVAIIPLLYALGMLALWHIYVVAAIYGSLMMVSLAGGPSLIPSLVHKEHLSTANALETLTFTLSGVVGPLLSGLLIASIGAPNVLVFDALSYLGFAEALRRIRRMPLMEDEDPEPDMSTLVQRRTLLDVARFALGNRVVLSTTLMFAAFNLGQGLLNVWLPIISDRLPGGGPELYGLLLGALALGEVVGSLLGGSAAIPVPLGSRICLAQVLCGASFGLLLLGQTSWLIAIALGLLGFFSGPLTIWAQTLRMEIIPPYFRGRAFALLRTIMQSAPPIGGVLGGPLLVLLGLSPVIAATAILMGLPGLLGYALPDLRKAHGFGAAAGDAS